MKLAVLIFNRVLRVIIVSAAFVVLTHTCTGREWLALFGSKNCSECAEIKELWRQAGDNADILEEFPVIVYVCIDDSRNYNYLRDIEQALGVKRPGVSFPVLLIGEHMVAGLDGFLEINPEVREDWLLDVPDEDLLVPFQQIADEATDDVVVELTYEMLEPYAVSQKKAVVAEKKDVVTIAAEHPELLYIFQTGCQKCSRQILELRRLAEDVPGLQLVCYNIADVEGQIMRQRVIEQMQLSADDAKNVIPPLLAWDDGYFCGGLMTNEELKTVLSRQSDETRHYWRRPITMQENSMMRKNMEGVVGGTTLGMVIVAGFLDGINPCAFATSIFLIGYLLYLKRKPSQIIIVGCSFCLGVFFTYILFGMGLSAVINWLNRYVWFKVGIYAVFALLTFVLAVFNVKDAIVYRRTNRASDMELKLSKDTHKKMHERIKKVMFLNNWVVVPAAFALGFVISAMELACTGQIYLPTIAAINSSGVTQRALGLLLLYNVAFIIPLIFVTLVAAYGSGTKKLAIWAKNNVFATKISMGVFFILLGVLMIWFASSAAPKYLPVNETHDCLMVEK